MRSVVVVPTPVVMAMVVMVVAVPVAMMPVASSMHLFDVAVLSGVRALKPRRSRGRGLRRNEKHTGAHGEREENTFHHAKLPS